MSLGYQRMTSSCIFLMAAMVIMTASASSASSIDLDEQHSTSLISWLKSQKGYFNPNLEMRRINPSDPTSHFGMFAKERIPSQSLLLRIPPNIVLDSDTKEPPELTPMICPLVRNLILQLELKGESAYAPYIHYLTDTQPPGQLPSAWTFAAQQLLVRMLGHVDFNLEAALNHWPIEKDLRLRNHLPPLDPIGWVEHEWANDCNSGSIGTKEEQYAALLVVQRAWDDILIPVYDMMSHRNGKWLNTASNDGGVHTDSGILVHAKRDIEQGEEIYTSYNMCEDCGGRVVSYGTSEILRDYGFVEQMPQSWIFPQLDLGFRIDLKDKDEGEGEDGEDRYVLTEWIEDDEPDEEGYEELQNLLKDVEHNKRMVDSSQRSKYPTILDHEWNTMREYMDAMDLALHVAIDWYEQVGSDGGGSRIDACVEEGTCPVSLDRYRDLEEGYETTNKEWYSSLTCDIEKQFKVFDDGTFDLIDDFKSQYQQINFLQKLNVKVEDGDQGDTCMDLDDTIQICASYRPHYHEYAVHQTTRFLPPNSVKRVLFVGGGDSMLLHEVLKYPSLELVVGLELDQKVTRGCFKHFGTQPHFDDERVEWWFGDASKSLLMLPKDYFGSFDLVLVDLSETVMSFKVTDKLDVLEALTLLVKPDGIFVKNEVYFGKFKKMFPYSVQIAWYDNPIICSQVMVMGSRTIDFMHPTLTEHGTENLVVRDLDAIEDDFDLFHDYAYNASSHHLCDTDSATNDLSKQVRSPGIIFVVEAEDVSVDIISNTDTLKKRLSDALTDKGFNLVGAEAISIQEGEKSIVSIVLREGYVIARAMAENKYCGFDIHFWSSLDKHEAAKDALVAAVESKAPALTSYRVIAGGMFGASTWKDDEKKRGPQFEELCKTIKGPESEDGSVLKDGDVKQADVDAAFAHGLGLIGHGNLKVAMLVGIGDEVKSIVERNKDSLERLESVNEVITLSCPSMIAFNEFSSEAGDSLSSCEKHLLEVVKNESSNESKISAIVIDASADQYTATILLKVFSARRKSLMITNPVLEDDAIVLSASFDESDDAWRRNLLLLFKDDVFIDSPSAFTDISFYNDDNDSGFNLLVTNDGGEHFFSNINRTLTELQNDNSATIKAKVQVVNGGEWLFQQDFAPSRSYLPSDYDQSQPLQQWESQQPLGHQFILQMEPNPKSKKKTKLSSHIVKKATENALSKSNLPGLDKSIIKEYKNLGDGCVLVCMWSGGSLVVLWDGKDHVDVNLFTYVEDIELGNVFESNFSKLVSLSTMLRDEQPRGVGRVVAYQRDLEDNDVPHWA